MRNSASWKEPIHRKAAKRTEGIRRRSRCLAEFAERRPEGMTRKGLLMLSSRMELGRRWLLRLKMRRLR
jgi:hypothetical protein